MTAVDLTATVGPLEWPTPLSLASGTCGYGAELEGLIDWSSVGAIFTKGLSLLPRKGNAPPRIWETASGMLNAIGLENVGVEAFAADKMDFLRKWRQGHSGRLVANLFATSLDEYRELTQRLDGIEGVDGVEINLSCPNVSAGGIEFGRTARGCEEVTRVVREATKKFVAVKLTPASVISDVAKASEAAGADAISVINTMPAMAIDVRRRVPRLSRGAGGLSGPALRPIAIRMVYEASQAVSIPVIGIGGVASGEDVAEFLLAGAVAVQVGTATFSEPNAAGRIRNELSAFLEESGCRSHRELIGALEPSERWKNG